MFPFGKAALPLSAIICLILPAFAQDEPGVINEGAIELAPFITFAGDPTLIDGLTGKQYRGADPVVRGFNATFKDLLVAYHKKLLVYEIQHMNLRTEAGKVMEEELIALTESFGIKKFKADRSQWLKRERSILHRLNTKPFFRIDSLVVWDVDRLNEMLPEMPKGKYAKDIRYNEETKTWERRVQTKWSVNYYHVNEETGRGWDVRVVKEDGLNLDTNKGFHSIFRGLTEQVPPGAFQEVQISYPMFYTRKKPVEAQIEYLQETYVSNLFHIYDPFTWVARRNNRFRGGFVRELRERVEKRNFRAEDRQWFNTVFVNFLNDIAQIKALGVKEIYELQSIQRWQNSPDVLGEGLDLLNWRKGEKRKGVDANPDAKIWINYDNPGGARFIVLDAYVRYGDRLVDAVRTRILGSKSRFSGKELFKQAIEEVSGVPFDKYYPAARKAQIQTLEKYRPNRD